MEKQQVAWKEYCAECWLKELHKSLNTCTGCRDITEILSKTALKTIQSYDHSSRNPDVFFFFPLFLCCLSFYQTTTFLTGSKSSCCRGQINIHLHVL